VVNVYCFLGSHGANYIPAITAKNKRLRDVLSLMDPSGQAIGALLMFFHCRQYPAYFHDCSCNHAKIL